MDTRFRRPLCSSQASPHRPAHPQPPLSGGQALTFPRTALFTPILTFPRQRGTGLIAGVSSLLDEPAVDLLFGHGLPVEPAVVDYLVDFVQAVQDVAGKPLGLFRRV